jgi:trigger factor
MQITVEDISSVKKTLRVEISKDEVAKEIDKAYDEIRRTAKIKGFRPGKTPRSVLEKMFKKDVLADVSSRLIQNSFVDALKEKGLKVLGRPKLDLPEFQSAQAYAYAAEVEVKPAIADLAFRGLKLKRNVYRVSDAEVDVQLKMIQKNMAKLEKISESRPASVGDHALIDFEGFKDGNPFPETPRTENFTLKLGDGRLLKEFDEQVVGMTPGTSKEFPLTFPVDYGNQSLAGQSVTFKVFLREIRKEILPEIDDALAKRVGSYESLEALKKGIIATLMQGYEKRAEHELNEQAFGLLLEQAQFEVPEILLEAELDSIIDEAERSFSHHSKTLADLGLSREILAEKYRDTARNQAQRHLILEKITEQENLVINEQELDAALQQMADSFRQPVAEVRQYYKDNAEKLDYLKQALLEKKAAKLIVGCSEIEDVDPQTAA